MPLPQPKGLISNAYLQIYSFNYLKLKFSELFNWKLIALLVKISIITVCLHEANSYIRT